MKLSYDPFKDLAAVSGGVNFPNVLVVHKGVGAKTLAEFVALAKKKPGSVDFASSGAASASHLAGELFNQRAGIEMVHVPYKGGAPALQDLLGERALPPTSRHHPPPCPMWNPASSSRLPPPARRGRPTCPAFRRWPNRAIPASRR